jgi:hypothetical protein
VHRHQRTLHAAKRRNRHPAPPNLSQGEEQKKCSARGSRLPRDREAPARGARQGRGRQLRRASRRLAGERCRDSRRGTGAQRREGSPHAASRGRHRRVPLSSKTLVGLFADLRGRRGARWTRSITQAPQGRLQVAKQLTVS